MSVAALVNPVAVAGHNEPPEPTPFEQSREEIEGLYLEAGNWLDGSGVKTQEDADQVSLLVNLIREAVKRADKRRTEENAPFDQAKAVVQARYAPLIADTKAQTGKAVLALDVCKKALQPFLLAQDAEKRAKAEALRREADAKAAAAQEALRVTRVADLQARAKAEAALQDAKHAERIAARAEADKATAKGGARAVSLVTSYSAEVVDLQAWARHCWTAYAAELRGFLERLAEEQVAAGRHDLPGITIHTIKTAR